MQNEDHSIAESEVFLLYNESEEGLEPVVEALRSGGIPVYFARQDLQLGSDFTAIENEKLSRAPVVLILLGERGWGPTQREIAQRVGVPEGRLVLALIGPPPTAALDDVGGIFRRLLYLDLQQGGSALRRLVGELRRRLGLPALPEVSPSSDQPRYDEIMTILLDGSDVDRSALLGKIQRGEISGGEALAGRLREATRSYSPENESDEVASRPTNWLTSIRSWMLSVLIWLDPENEDTADLILRHLDVSFEPNASVRFWALAGVIQRRLSYLREALQATKLDNAAEVQGLAAIARDPQNKSTLAAFRSAIETRQFDQAWHVLRILRIYPIPELAENIVRLLEQDALDRTIRYDALFALSHPEMAQAVRAAVADGMGLDRLTTIVLREARGVAGIARRAFAGVLSMFEPRAVQAGLMGAASDEEERRTARNLIDEIAELQSSGDDGIPPTPGQANDDVDITRDSIGIARDVRTLASVMLSREVEPPLAIGLFGEWGSGKSFYIKSIEAEIDRIADQSTASAPGSFCTRVVQIHFNAWHYIDTNLWASLVSHLLDGLAAHLTPRPSMTEQRSALAKDLASAKDAMALAQGEQQSAAAQLQATSLELEQRIADRETRELTLRDFQLGDLTSLLATDAALKKTLGDALTAVGASKAIESIGELNEAVDRSRTATGQTIAFAVSVFRGGNVFWVIGGILALLVLPPIIGHLVQSWTDANLAILTTIAAQVSVAAVTAAGVLGTAVSYAKKGLSTLSEAKKKIDKKLDEKRSAQTAEETKLKEALIEARASEKAAAERVTAATIRAQELENRVAALADSQSLGFFISERTKSDDYRRHLGLISTIRKDFDSLMERIGEGREGEKGVDRIVLYIDDVDRCPPEMVVNILQAVHLLLAYKLFVVVVSVDPRWLLRSLGSRISQLQQDDDAGAGLVATPQDYLEKIFQIPFTVRPMGQHGFSKLIRALLAPGATSVAQAIPEDEHAGRIPVEVARVPRVQDDRPDQEEPVQDGLANADVRGRFPHREDVESEKVILGELPPEQLTIKPGEVDFAATLHEALATPRSAKRFANIYRLLKCSVPRGELARFEGTQTVRGDFQLPMLLLALVVGRSRLAEKLFPQMLRAAQAGRSDWWDAGWKAAGVAEDDPLRASLDLLVESSFFPKSAELAAVWLPQVARFSFTTARLFLEAA